MKLSTSILISICLLQIVLSAKLMSSSKFIPDNYDFGHFAKAILNIESIAIEHNSDNINHIKSGLTLNDIDENSKIMAVDFHELIDIFKAKDLNVINNNPYNGAINKTILENNTQNKELNKKEENKLNNEILNIRKIEKKSEVAPPKAEILNIRKIEKKSEVAPQKAEILKIRKIEKKSEVVPPKAEILNIRKTEKKSEVAPAEVHKKQIDVKSVVKKVILTDIFDELKDKNIMKKKVETGSNKLKKGQHEVKNLLEKSKVAVKSVNSTFNDDVADI